MPVFITVIADHDKPQPSGCLLGDIYHGSVDPRRDGCAF
ncbi:hemolysin activation protein [Shigella flexneri]|nr:hemolysin activation protein [Shigella flexneri]